MFLLKNIDIKFTEGLIFSLVAILIVFAVLLIIILFVALLSKIKFKSKAVAKPSVKAAPVKKLTIEDIKDEDMMVAALIATAEFVEETKQRDARLVSIKRIG